MYNSKPNRKDKPTSIRLSIQDRKRIAMLSGILEISQTSVIKLAIKHLAEKEGIRDF